jgi:4-amino-4-deoxy-L-arabinose transferase-like glycosyltransferase
VALLTVALWTSQAGQQRWRASYLSESTTALCWLLGWWCLLQWRGDRRSRWLLALAAITGLAAITRPMAALAFAIPVGVVVVGDCWRRRTWRPLVGALALGSATLGVIPVQNMAVLGDWRVSPLSLYTRQYMPFDRLGFGLDTTPADLGLTPQLDAAMASLRQRHADHVPSALPGVLVDRLRALGRSIFGGWRLVFIPAAMVGVVLLPTAGWLALATAATLLICYLPYAHEAHWSVYYVEAMPVAALVVALGAVAILRRLENRADGSRWGTTGLAVLALGMAAPEMLWSGRFKVAAQQPLQAFRAAASAVHGRDLLVFVRYADDFDGHQSFVHNVADIGRARVVTAHDLGPAINDRVRAAFPNRSTYRYDTGSQRLSEVESGQ